MALFIDKIYRTTKRVQHATVLMPIRHFLKSTLEFLGIFTLEARRPIDTDASQIICK